MARVTARWTGLKVLQRRLQRGRRKLEKETDRRLAKITKGALTRIISLTPRDTGGMASKWFSHEKALLVYMIDHPYNVAGTLDDDQRLVNDGLGFNLLLVQELGTKTSDYLIEPRDDSPYQIARKALEKEPLLVSRPGSSNPLLVPQRFVIHPGVKDPSGMMRQTVVELPAIIRKEFKEMLRALFGANT